MKNKIKYYSLVLLPFLFFSCAKTDPSVPNEENGTYSIWTKTDLGFGSIDIYIDNSLAGTVSHFNSNGISCGHADINIQKPQGTYNFSAQGQTGGNWAGTLDFENGQCKTLELKGSSNPNSGNSGSSCNWLSMIKYIQVIKTQYGVRCGSSSSLEITYKNTSNTKLITAICFKKNDGTWEGYSDYGVDAGTTTSLFMCNNASGVYKIYAMKFSDNGGCAFPNCN